MTFEQWVQSRLRAYGWPIRVDGDWGRSSIEALKQFQQRYGLMVTGIADNPTVAMLRLNPDASQTPATSAPPSQIMPVWMSEMHRRMGLHEVRNKTSLIEFLKIGRYLGDPASLPWCGDAVESCIAKTLPSEALPSNPFFAQAWATFGVDAQRPIVGSIGVIRWSASSGHVGIVAGVDGNRVHLLGGNQSNAINISAFDMGTKQRGFIAFRWPSSVPVKSYPALQGRAVLINSEVATR